MHHFYKKTQLFNIQVNTEHNGIKNLLKNKF